MDQGLVSRARQIVDRFIDRKRYQVFIFGSQASKTAWRGSDVDIGIRGEERVPARTMARLRAAFEESNFPYMVDVVDFHLVDRKFQDLAQKHMVEL